MLPHSVKTLNVQRVSLGQELKLQKGASISTELLHLGLALTLL